MHVQRNLNRNAVERSDFAAYRALGTALIVIAVPSLAAESGALLAWCLLRSWRAAQFEAFD